MNYVELSLENVKDKCNDLYNKIKEDKFNYDLVIFIAEGSYIIGHELSRLNNVPLLEIHAKRHGGGLKKLLKPLFRFIPKKVLIKLREKEMKSDYHETNSDREISFDIEVYKKYQNCKNILLVDDSIDSGNSIKLTKSAIDDFFSNSNVKVAVFNIMSKSTIKADYNLYTDMMICGPWSNDSKENSEYKKSYYKWRDGVEY